MIRPAVLTESQTIASHTSHREFRRPIPRAYRLFFRESLRSIRSTASVFPSSRFLSAALLEPIDFRTARVIVELGPGTGAITAEILRRLRPDGCLYAVERNQEFIRHLGYCNDSRLTLIHASAEGLQSQLSARGIQLRQVDAVVSSLGLTTMNPKQRACILRQARACLIPGGTMTQYQYITSFADYVDIARLRLHKFRAGELLENYFRHVSVRRVLFNVPPAHVFACR